MFASVIGINVNTALKLDSYVHMRDAESKRIQKKLQRKAMAFSSFSKR